MLMVALVLAVIGLAALVTAVVTSNEIVAWVCIAASSLGVILLVVDAVRERQTKRAAGPAGAAVDAETTEVIEQLETDRDEDSAEGLAEDLAEDLAGEEVDLDEEIAEEDHPEEVVHDEPEYDTYSDDEPEYPEPAEESALHTVDEGPDEQAVDDSDAVDPEKR